MCQFDSFARFMGLFGAVLVKFLYDLVLLKMLYVNKMRDIYMAFIRFK